MKIAKDLLMRWPFLMLLGLNLVVSAAQVQGQHFKAVAGENKKFTDCAQCPEMVVVPAGSFMMGSPQDEPKRVNEHEDQVRVSISKAVCGGGVCSNAW